MSTDGTTAAVIAKATTSEAQTTIRYFNIEAQTSVSASSSASSSA